MITKQTLKDLLKQNILVVSFKKIDGTDRKMTCSLKEDIVPVLESKEPKRKKPENDNVLPVWDMEKSAFRSFRIDSLIEYSVLKEGYEL